MARAGTSPDLRFGALCRINSSAGCTETCRSLHVKMSAVMNSVWAVLGFCIYHWSTAMKSKPIIIIIIPLRTWPASCQAQILEKNVAALSTGRIVESLGLVPEASGVTTSGEEESKHPGFAFEWLSRWRC